MRHRHRGHLPVLVAIAVLALAMLPVAGADAARKVPKEFFGLVQGGPTDPRDMEQMHAIKVKTIRIGFNWRRIEPRPGVYRWPDALVAMLAKNRIRPVLTVQTAPEWATGAGHPGAPPITAKEIRAWKGFLKKAVQRYGPKGSFWRDHPGLPNSAVTAWQIWNEPNLPKSFTRDAPGPPRLVKHAPKVYAKLVKASDETIGKVTKHAKVILAGLLGTTNRTQQQKMSPEKFLKQFFRVRRIKRHFDAVGLHPYVSSIKKYEKVVTRIRKAMRKGGVGRKGLWLDEVGWGSANDGFRLNRGEHGQAKLLKKSFELTLEHRKKWNISHLLWFDWRDPSQPYGCSFCSSAGLLNFDRSPKPSYKYFKHFTRLQGKSGRHHHHHGGNGPSSAFPQSGETPARR